jgi:hypothetical protein
LQGDEKYDPLVTVRCLLLYPCIFGILFGVVLGKAFIANDRQIFLCWICRSCFSCMGHRFVFQTIKQ